MRGMGVSPVPVQVLHVGLRGASPVPEKMCQGATPLAAPSQVLCNVAVVSLVPLKRNTGHTPEYLESTWVHARAPLAHSRSTAAREGITLARAAKASSPSNSAMIAFVVVASCDNQAGQMRQG